jgi:hypothetical protein
MTSGTQIAETATDGTEERSKLKKLGMLAAPKGRLLCMWIS